MAYLSVLFFGVNITVLSVTGIVFDTHFKIFIVCLYCTIILYKANETALRTKVTLDVLWNDTIAKRASAIQ